MAYTDIEAGVLSVLLACPSPAFTAATARRNDWKVLDAKAAPVVAHVSMGEDSIYGPEVQTRMADAYGEHGAVAARHVVAVTLAVPRRTGQGGDGAALAALLSYTDSLIAYLNTAALSISGVIDALVIRVTTPRELLTVPGERVGTHVAQRIHLELLETI